MKLRRHEQILKLISEQDIETQDELLEQLQKYGFHTTQATISRDMKELQLIKVQKEDGTSRYAVGTAFDSPDMSFKFHAVFKESVIQIDYSENLVVIRCYVGMANAACAALDSIHWNGLVGTIAGDDTILCVMRDKAQSSLFVNQLKKLLKS